MLVTAVLVTDLGVTNNVFTARSKIWDLES